MKIPVLFRIAQFYSKQFLVYPVETLALMLRRTLVVGLLLYFWYLVGKSNDIEQLKIVPYILIASGTMFLAVGHNFRQAFNIAQEIKYGQLSNILARPYDELKYELGIYLGNDILEFIFSFVTIAIGLFLLDTLPAQTVLLFAASLVPALLIGYSLNILVAASTFWIIESGYLRLLSFFFLRIISGMFLPLTFFGDFWSAVLQYLPFAQVAFVPSYVLSGDDYGRALSLVAAGLAWSVIMLWLCRTVWSKGLRRFGAVGI